MLEGWAQAFAIDIEKKILDKIALTKEDFEKRDLSLKVDYTASMEEMDWIRSEMKTIELGLKEWAEDRVERDIKRAKTDLEQQLSRVNMDLVSQVGSTENRLNDKIKTFVAWVEGVKNDL